MSKRHADALAIQMGACNPSGVALSIVAACKEIREEKDFAGTASITNDPAVKLMVHQLAFICGVTSGVHDMAHAPDYSQCTRDCEAKKELLK